MKYLQVVIEKTHGLREKLKAQEEQKTMNKEIYAKKLVLSELRAREAGTKIQQMEEVERQLVDRLKATSNKHREALAALNKVALDGRDYYSQAYSEKKALIAERNSSLPHIARGLSESQSYTMEPQASPS